MKPRIKTRSSLFVVIVLATLVLTSVSVPRWGTHIPGVSHLTFVAQASGGKYDKYDVIAKLVPGVDVRDVSRRHDLPITKNLADTTYLFRLRTSDRRTVEQVLAELRTDTGVVWAEPNHLARVPELDGFDQASSAFLDQRSMAFVDGLSPAAYFAQYAMRLLGATQAQTISTGAGVTVAVIDTGIDAGHPVFKHVTVGYDFVSGDTNPAEEGTGSGYGHGTMVAGIIALVAPQVTIMPLRVFQSDGSGTAANIASAIRWATDHGARVINMSFGMTDSSGVISSALDYAKGRDVVLVASAGNNNTSVPQYPASGDDVLAVAATDQHNLKASFSNYGSWVDVAAPGVSIYSAYPGGQWAYWSGTSFAAPFVSGEAALLLSVGRDTSRIQDTAVNVGSGLGKGRINCLAAVSK